MDGHEPDVELTVHLLEEPGTGVAGHRGECRSSQVHVRRQLRDIPDPQRFEKEEAAHRNPGDLTGDQKQGK